MKKIVFGVLALVLVMALVLSFVLSDKSKMIKNAYINCGLVVSTETLDHPSVSIYLDDLSPEQLEKVTEYEILYCHIPTGNIVYKGVVIVCPSAREAKKFLNMNGENLYEEMKEEGKVQGNCILFTYNRGMVDIFEGYIFGAFY